MSLEDWCSSNAKLYPQFKFWLLILQIQLDVLVYVRAIRKADFQLYVDALTKIVPWFFALDHTHYARWIPVHLRDMVTLKEVHPTVFAEFMKGNFAVKKTANRFSAIAIDQAHEPNNSSVKDDCGAVGLTENPAALRRWMVSGPEMARVIGEFETSIEKRKHLDLRHHEEAKHVQKSFVRDVKNLTNTIEEMGNPFTENSSDLLVLDSRDLADPSVVDTVRRIEEIGQEQYDTYVKERLISQIKSIFDPIKKNNLPLFSRPPVREKTKSQFQLTSLKNDRSLFSRLYVASQVRNGNLDEFFEYENQASPPAFSQNGKFRMGTKSDLVGCLEDLVAFQRNVTHPTVEVTILDGSVIVNMLRPGSVKTYIRRLCNTSFATLHYIPVTTCEQTRHRLGRIPA